MHAIVVYESHWGCTMAVAQAIAEGIGKEARALTTDEATPEVVAGADLIVAGAPVIAFALPRTGATAQLAGDTKAPRPADVSHPLLRSWLEGMPAGRGRFAAFETRIWWSPRGSTGTIESRLSKAGYRSSPRRSVSSSPAPTGRFARASSNGPASGARRSRRRSAHSGGIGGLTPAAPPSPAAPPGTGAPARYDRPPGRWGARSQGPPASIPA